MMLIEGFSMRKRRLILETDCRHVIQGLNQPGAVAKTSGLILRYAGSTPAARKLLKPLLKQLVVF